MNLSSDLISQFVKATKDDKPKKHESTVYGTVKEHDSKLYVQIDGSELLTPISTTADMKIGERVMVQIKDHTATVVGNISSPAARTEDVRTMNEEFQAEKAKITTLESENVDVKERLTATEGDIKTLKAGSLTVEDADIKYAAIEMLNAVTADVKDLKTDKLDTTVANATFATIENLNAANAKINILETDKLDASVANVTYATIDSLNSTNAEIEKLQTNKLDATTADIKYANLDFANINMTSVKTLFSKSGIIKDLVVNDTKITGELVGVTIKGDLIEGNTVVADKLVVKGTDGLYYKLNTDGIKTEAEQTEYNSLNGSVITTKTITASKIAVDDLVAFDATIGGFNITEKSIYSGAKTSATNTTRGIYLDKEGQMSIGDSTNYVKYYKGQNGDYKLEISADSVLIGGSSKSIETTLNEVSKATQTNASDLASYISTTNTELENLQGQIDGSITTWFYEYAPTNNNVPASQWTTTDLKNVHLGDLFYDTITGYCYRWQVQNNTYSWNRITDVDVTKALADAAAAQDTADSKRRVFTSTPTPPYEIGDLWVQGSSGDIMRCQTTKTANQSYALADWVKASKYTDDTAANTAQADANALKVRMTSAETTISKNSEEILLRASKTEVANTYATKIALNTTNANVTTAQNTANSAVTKADNAQACIDNLEIGGRNLILNSATIGLYGSDDGNNNCAVKEDDYVKITPVKDGNVYAANGVATSIARKKGVEYTLSFEVLTPTKIGFYWYPNEHYAKTNYIQASDKWQKVVFTYTQTGDDTITKTLFGLNGLTANEVYCYRNLKLEIGNKATDWTPAPEDLENNLNVLENRITLAETTITQNSDAISLKAEKTEVETAKAAAISAASSDATTKANNALSNANSNTANLLKEYSKTSEMNAAIQLKADSITNSVSSTYATKTALTNVQNIAETAKDDIDNLEIGGRNLFTGFGDEEIRITDYQNKGSYRSFSKLTIQAADYVGKEFTVSFWAKSPNGDTQLQLYNRNGDPRYFSFDTVLDNALGTEWKYYTYTFVNTDRGESYTAIYNRIEIYAPNQMGVIVKKIKVEMGNRATDWTPAPEYVNDKIDSVDARVTTAESSITQLSNKITANVTETTGLTTRISSLEQTASGFEARLNTTDGNVTTAQTTADNAKSDIDSLRIGGRNLIVRSAETKNYWINTSSAVEACGAAYKSAVSDYIPIEPYTKYTFSRKTSAASDGGYFRFAWYDENKNAITRLVYSDLERTTNSPYNAAYIRVAYPYDAYPKLEKGTRATDWSPAPEDVDLNISEASKTATNYLGFSSSGLVIGDMTASTLGENVLIDSNSVDIREGTTTLASFGASTIYLGKNSETSVINLCNGAATMRVKDNTDFRIYTDKRLVMSAYDSMLLDCWRDSTHMTRIAIQSSDPDDVSMVGGVQFTIYQDNIQNTVQMLGNDIIHKVTNGTNTTYTTMHESIFKVNTSGTIVLNSPSSVQIGDSSSYSFGLRLGSTYTKNKSINCYWSDGEVHDLLNQSSNGQTCYYGAADIGEVTNTNVRGKYVRLYAHSGGAVYLGASGSTAITSDRNMKKDIVDVDDKYIDFFDRLRPITYKYNVGHRDHIGFIAQEVEEALTASGLTTEQFAGLVIEQDVTLNPNHDSSLSDEENAANETHYDTLYSLRYEEFISLLVKKVQNLQTQINELERRLS